jgi:probable rRNA maturation factor
VSNILDNNRPNSASEHGLIVEIESHLDEEPEPSMFGGAAVLPIGYREALSAASVAAARFRGFTQGAIEIAIVDDTQIRDLNKRHLQHDWETDVISFPYDLRDDVVEGELIVSWETAVREAERTGWPPLTELVLYVVHGTLHLVGLEDSSESERAEMRAAEQQVFKLLKPMGFEKYDVGGAVHGAGAKGDSTTESQL